MIKTYDQFLKESETYIRLCDEFVETYGLQSIAQVDHICYKCHSSDEYEYFREQLEAAPPTKFSYQVFISERRVSYFALYEPIALRSSNPIRYLELADKKPTFEKSLGFHHVELFPKTMNYIDFIGSLRASGIDPKLKNRPHHTTYDIELGNDFIVRLTDQPLIKKILNELNDSF